MLSTRVFYHVFGLASCIALLYASFGDVMLDLNLKFREPNVSFVSRNGTHFVVDGRAFYVNGWNSYWLMDQAVEEFNRPRVRAMFQTGAEMGLTVCRTWAFNDGSYNALQVSLGKFDERVFKALDVVVYEAKRQGIRLILCLANNLKAFGGKTQYVKWAWEDGVSLSSSTDSFYFDPSIRSYFRHYMKTILTRKNHLTGLEYRDDPTIFAWELMNEPQCLSDPSGDTLQKWIEEMTKYAKSIDNKHLLTVGLEGFYGSNSPQEKLSINPGEWFNTLGADFIRNSKILEIDFASVHSYPDQWLPEAGFDMQIQFMSRWVNSHIEDGELLRKPILFTEFGFSSNYKNFSHSHQEELYKGVYDTIYDSARKKRAGAGAFIWQLFVGGMPEYSDHYEIVPGERPSLYRLIKNQSCRLAAITNTKHKHSCSM